MKKKRSGRPPKLRRVIGTGFAGPEGSVWATLGEGYVLHFSGKEWRLFRQGQGFRAKHDFGRLVVDRQGEVWLPYAKGLYTWKQEKWETAGGQLTEFTDRR